MRALNVDHRLVDAIFDERRAARHAPQPPGVGFVLGKEQLGRSLAGQPVVAKLVMPGPHETNARCFPLDRRQRRPVVVIAPGPRVAEPERGEQAQGSCIRSAVGGAHADQHVEWVDFGVFHADIEVAVLCEDARVDQLVFGFLAAPAAVRGDEVVVRERALRVFVERLHVRVRRGVVEKEVVLLHVFPVVALRVRQPEEALLQDGVGLVPQGQGETEPLLVVADPQQAVLTPAVGVRAGLVVRQEVPGVPFGRIILAHGPPLPLAEVGSPAVPGLPVLVRFLQPIVFYRCHCIPSMRKSRRGHSKDDILLRFHASVSQLQV